jgi:hypothetical protein
MDLSVFAAPSGGGPAPDALAPHLAPHLASRRPGSGLDLSRLPAPGYISAMIARAAARLPPRWDWRASILTSSPGPGPGLGVCARLGKGGLSSSTAIEDGAPEEIVWGQSGPGRAHSAA